MYFWSRAAWSALNWPEDVSVVRTNQSSSFVWAGVKAHQTSAKQGEPGQTNELCSTWKCRSDTFPGRNVSGCLWVFSLVESHTDACCNCMTLSSHFGPLSLVQGKLNQTK
ncbi:hypothetical protein AMECASPLE_036604 [Ameca splendens]|uniref:Uncharacterized protein n=1 Tax=Ameca splendens TaxID=208324 RepID=A0ABV1AEZ3_9TELE